MIKTLRVRLKKNQPTNMGFKHNKIYTVIPDKITGVLFYRRPKLAGIWLANRFDIVKGKK